MPAPVLDGDTPGWDIAGAQMERDDQYSSDENIEESLGFGFNSNTRDFKKHLDAGLGIVWTTTHNQPDYFQNLPKYRLKQMNEVMDKLDTNMEHTDPGPLSRAPRLSLGSDSTSLDLAQQPQRTDELDDMSPLIVQEKMIPRIENIIPRPESVKGDQQQVMYVSYKN